jgi:hypothetical protein
MVYHLHKNNQLYFSDHNEHKFVLPFTLKGVDLIKLITLSILFLK